MSWSCHCLRPYAAGRLFPILLFGSGTVMTQPLLLESVGARELKYVGADVVLFISYVAR